MVTRASATQTYYTASYEHRCVGTGNPPPQCKPCQAVINDGVWKVRTAEVNKEQGYLPPQEKAELEQLVKDLQKCP